MIWVSTSRIKVCLFIDFMHVKQFSIFVVTLRIFAYDSHVVACVINFLQYCQNERASDLPEVALSHSLVRRWSVGAVYLPFMREVGLSLKLISSVCESLWFIFGF